MIFTIILPSCIEAIFLFWENSKKKKTLQAELVKVIGEHIPNFLVRNYIIRKEGYSRIFSKEITLLETKDTKYFILAKPNRLIT